MAATWLKSSPVLRSQEHTIKRLSAAQRARQIRLHAKREGLRLARLDRGQGIATHRTDGKSGILSFYLAEARLRPERQQVDQRTLKYPKVFSFFDDPVETVRFINRLAASVAENRSREVFIDQSECEKLDIAAEAVCSVLAREAREKQNVRFQAAPPADDEVKTISFAVGMPRLLGLKPANQEEHIRFGLVRGRKRRESAYRTSMREDVTTKLTEYIDGCLRHYGNPLSLRQASYLARLVGEVIGNAEDHSRRRDWWVGGYMRMGEHGYGDCHITLFNFGRPIAESLKTLPENSVLYEDIHELVDKHRKRRFFLPDVWQDDDLWTLYALQGRVSRKNDSPLRVGDQGQGTADMIEFFQKLGQSGKSKVPPRMCVVSGNTCIHFDGKYQLQRQTPASGLTRRIIAFNSANDLAERPDERYVKHMKERFPGTLITMHFFLDREHLDAVGREDS